MSFLWEHWRDVGLAKIFDLGVIAVLIYLAMVWLKHRASRALAGVLILVVLLYSLARLIDMPFTLVVFREGFTVIAVALLLIFQKDLRWAFERLASSANWGKPLTESSEEVVETLAEAAGALAKSKTGALIVLQGGEPLDQDVRGGIPLDARISMPLLLSVFEPKSPGHDGAVIVKEGRAVMFGAHLPLSSGELSEDLGTRHSAGLGLAEVVDAFVVIVSEERGTISVARNGAIEVLESVATLKQRIDAFHTQTFSPEQTPFVRRLFLKNWGLKAASVILAAGLSIIFADRSRTVQRTFEIPVEYANRPDDWLLESPNPPRVGLTLSASESAFETLDASRLKLTLDAGKLEEGRHSVTVNEKQLNVPALFKIESIQPASLRVATYRLKPVRVKVAISKVGLPADGYSVSDVRLVSNTVTLLWPIKHSQPPEFVWTETLVLARVTSDQTVQLRLQIPPNAKPADENDSTVPVEVKVRKVKRPGKTKTGS